MKRITESKEFRASWAAGTNVEDMAVEFGVSSQSIYRAAKRFEYPRRSRKGIKNDHRMVRKFKPMQIPKPIAAPVLARKTSFWTAEMDELIRATKGAWSKIAVVAEAIGIPTRHATARWHIIRAMK